MVKVIIHGIPNCDITKKALAWLKKHKIDFDFHDYKTAGISKTKLENWCSQVGWETILNKRSTTWRTLPAVEQAATTTQQAAIRIMMENSSIIKRPVIEAGKKLLVGFSEENYSKQLK